MENPFGSLAIYRIRPMTLRPRFATGLLLSVSEYITHMEKTIDRLDEN